MSSLCSRCGEAIAEGLGPWGLIRCLVKAWGPGGASGGIKLICVLLLFNPAGKSSCDSNSG